MRPKVSVCVITYNHEPYIRQCLDSILNQQVSFEFDIVIGEDKSTDGTGDIVREYEQRYPGVISVISPVVNGGGQANFERAYTACKGQYIAYVDGDDYWSSVTKLQKQVDLLDLHPEYAMCIHDVEIMEEGNIPKGRSLPSFADGAVFSVKDVILRGWFIASASMVIRNTERNFFPEWIKDVQCGDLAFQLLVTAEGDIGYIGKKLAVYRLNTSSVSLVFWVGKENKRCFAHIETFKRFNKYTEGKYWQFIKMRLGRIYQELMRINPALSKIYIHALISIIGLGATVYVPMLKHWIVVNLIPSWVYKLYTSSKVSTVQKAHH